MLIELLGSFVKTINQRCAKFPFQKEKAKVEMSNTRQIYE